MKEGAEEEGRRLKPGAGRGAATALSEDNGEREGGVGRSPRRGWGLAPTDPAWD